MGYYYQRSTAFLASGRAAAWLQAGQRLSSLRQVLLIDDNPLQLSVREAVLRNAGFVVAVATTAETALATLRALPDRFGVVVTDHLMPGCSGSELVRQIRADANWLPVIVLSGLADAESEYQGMDVIFRPKPLPPPELIELVRNCLQNGNRHQGAA
jgi:DNA-binding NtrC family response regulator